MTTAHTLVDLAVRFNELAASELAGAHALQDQGSHIDAAAAAGRSQAWSQAATLLSQKATELIR